MWQQLRLLLKVGRGYRTQGLDDPGTRGRGDSGTWYTRTLEIGDARGFEDVINK